jgi:hypothetical protein
MDRDVGAVVAVVIVGDRNVAVEAELIDGGIERVRAREGDVRHAGGHTVATFDGTVITCDTVERTSNGYLTLAPSADFALTPGLEKTFTVYLFPYRLIR